MHTHDSATHQRSCTLARHIIVTVAALARSVCSDSMIHTTPVLCKGCPGLWASSVTRTPAPWPEIEALELLGAGPGQALSQHSEAHAQPPEQGTNATQRWKLATEHPFVGGARLQGLAGCWRLQDGQCHSSRGPCTRCGFSSIKVTGSRRWASRVGSVWAVRLAVYAT